MGPRACFVKMTLEIECRVLNDLKNDFFMCSGVVSPHGLKNDECYMRSALVSRQRTTNVTCVARLFRVMA